MIEATIRCVGCGFEGKSGEHYRSEGHDPFRGRLYYHCPSCARDLFVDPMEALGSSKVEGLPVHRHLVRSQRRRRLNACMGLTGIGLALFLIAGFSPYWWAYIAAAVLLAIVWLCEEPVSRSRYGEGPPPSDNNEGSRSEGRGPRCEEKNSNLAPRASILMRDRFDD